MEDKFNEGMSCITRFVFLHVILRRSQMLLKFTRDQMIYNVLYVILCAEVTCKGSFVMQYQSKEQNQTLDLWSLPTLFHIYAYRVSNHQFYSLLLNLSNLLCWIDVEISPRCMVNPKARILWILRKEVGIKLSTNREHGFIVGTKKSIVVRPHLKLYSYL